jgi:hypothetical protein
MCSLGIQRSISQNEGNPLEFRAERISYIQGVPTWSVFRERKLEMLAADLQISCDHSVTQYHWYHRRCHCLKLESNFFFSWNKTVSFGWQFPPNMFYTCLPFQEYPCLIRRVIVSAYWFHDKAVWPRFRTARNNRLLVILRTAVQLHLNQLDIEECYWALFYVSLYTLFTQFAEWDCKKKLLYKVSLLNYDFQFNSIQFIYVQNLTATGQLQS